MARVEPALRRQHPRRDEQRTLIAVQDEIKQLILDRQLGPGDPLPTESELVDLLRVGRNTVREALKSLQALDLVDIRHGYGTYVGGMSLTPLADGLTFRLLQQMPDGVRGLTELLEIREDLEASLIRKVTPTLPPDVVEDLDALVDDLATARREGGDAIPADRAFHQLLYRDLDNRLALQLLDTFWIVYQRLTARIEGLMQPDELVDEHRAIVDALRANDVTRAEKAVREHFSEIHGRLARVPAAQPTTRREKG